MFVYREYFKLVMYKDNSEKQSLSKDLPFFFTTKDIYSEYQNYKHGNHK